MQLKLQLKLYVLKAKPMFTFAQPKLATENKARPMFTFAQPKPATENNANPIFTLPAQQQGLFTFPAGQQDLPKTKDPRNPSRELFPMKGNQQSSDIKKDHSKITSFNEIPLWNGPPDPSKEAFNFHEPFLVSAFSDIPVEEYPKSKFFSLNFQSSLYLGLQLAKDSAALMEELLTHQESDAYAMDSSQINCQITQMKKAGELNNFFNTETIAFWGSSLAGKSSVINSLLDFPRLAAADDFGSAVTSIVTEYRQMRPGQTERIKVEIEYLCGVALEDHINELLWSFRRQFLDAKDSLSNDDIKECREAGSALQSAFGNERGYTRQFMSDKSEGAFERIADQLIKWTKTIPWPAGASDGKWVTNAETAEEFHTKTSLFMQDRIWPFTHIMRVYIDAPILRAGLVIADSPGLGDTNFARVKAATTYLSGCDLIFHITDIRRALTDKRLKSSIQNTSSHNAPASKQNFTKKWPCTAVICTMADIIDEAGADRYLRNSGSVKILEAMENIEDEIRKVDATKDPLSVTELQWKKKKLFIEARNKRVEDGLKKEYGSKQEDLRVLCVSNLFYGECSGHESGPRTQDKRSISGIPALRMFCYSALVDSRLQEAKNFLLTTLPSALASIGLRSQALEAGPTCSIENIIDEVNLTKWGILKDLKRSQESLHHLFDRSLFTYAETHRKEWQRVASKKGLEWLDLALVDYQAFCLKSGRHVDEFNEAVDWNSELISQMRLGLGERWNGMEKDLSAISLDIHELIKRRLQGLTADLRTNNFPSLMVESLKHRTQDTRQFIETAWSKFESRMRGLRAKTLESNEASFILQEMIPAYRAAASFEGPGKAKALRAKVQGRIDNGSLFPNMISAMSSGMKDASNKTFDELKAMITDSVIASIIGDIHSVYSTITLAKKPNEERDEQTAKEASSLEMLQIKCRGLDDRYQWIIKQIE